VKITLLVPLTLKGIKRETASTIEVGLAG
jgi:hypothetical protein